MKTFDPGKIPKYCVISLPHKFEESEHRLSKRFVVICHRGGYAICLKATSKVKIYINNREQMAGCVFYKARECPIFEQDTAIQPDNQIPINHAEIRRAHAENSLDIQGPLPSTFESKLIRAIRDSVTLTQRERQRLYSILGVGTPQSDD